MELNSQIKDLKFDNFIKICLENVSKVMKISNSLPLADYEYWSIDKCFKKSVDVQSSRMINMIQYILSNHGFKNRLAEGKRLDDEDILACVISICDQLMERINMNLDEASGKKPSNSLLLVSKQNTSGNVNIQIKSIPPSYSLMTQKSIPKPQASFKEKVDNSELPFKPSITYKPHALKPLEDSLTLEDNEFTHPYGFELNSLEIDEGLLKPVEPKRPLSLEETQCTYIDTEQQLDALVLKLQLASEIAIDLEHHSFRSFQGFTCLMQISSRTEDFIVDTIALRHRMHVLNSVFTDPHILKVLHGCDSDVQWLQKDFSLYLVNCFDTGQAARLLQLPHLSLAYLLQIFCDVTADKKFQKADWRIRELPAMYLRYAREDTHYLLYICDLLRNMLLARAEDKGLNNEVTRREEDKGLNNEVTRREEDKNENFLLQTFLNTNEICKKKYKKPVLNESSHLELYKRRMGRGGGVLSRRSLEVLKRLYAWRDKLARMEDESTGYILPDEIMLQVAQTMPITDGAIISCCKSYIPPTLKRQLEDVKMIINDVINLPLYAENLDQQSDKDLKEFNNETAKRFLPSFIQSSFDQLDYDHSVLNSQCRVNSRFGSSILHVKEQEFVGNPVLKRLNKILLPYFPEEMIPNNYKVGTFKVRYTTTLPIETRKEPVTVEPAEVKTTPEIKFSQKIELMKNKKEHLVEKKSKQHFKSTANANDNTKVKKDSLFKAKTYKIEELKGNVNVKEMTGKKERRKKESYDANEDQTDHPIAAKKSRKNFHKSNKSQSFMPQKKP